jgi:hypothetical protein
VRWEKVFSIAQNVFFLTDVYIIMGFVSFH